MYRHNSPFRPGGATGPGRGAAPPPPQQQPHLNPNFFPNPNNPFFHHQNPNFYPQPNPFVQNPDNFSQFRHLFPNPPNPSNNNVDKNIGYSNFPQQVNLRNETIEKLDKAAISAHKQLMSSNESVSAWKVSQAALMMVKAESWESLGFRMQQVPSLNRLLVTEGKINAFIHCFVAVRRITSLYDLEMAICESEGIERFEELNLGPLVRHPLVVHYFAVTSDVTEVHKIRTEEIIFYLSEFMETHSRKEVKVDTFLDFISKNVSISGREKLGVRIQNLGMYIYKIKQAKLSEDTVLNKSFEKLKTSAVKRSMKRPLFSAEKSLLDHQFTAISERVKSFSSENTQFCGKHTRFVSSSSEESDSGDNVYEDTRVEKNVGNQCSSSLSNGQKPDRISNCPYPSATEEMTRLGLKSEADCINSAPDSGVSCNLENELSNRKRRYENVSVTTTSSRKLPKRKKFGLHLPKDLGNQGHSLSDEALQMFVTTWKEACRSNNADEVLERMLQFYNTKKKKKVKAVFASYPFVGLLNAAVFCIKSGMWDNMYDTFQAIDQQGIDSENFEGSADYISIGVEQAKDDNPAQKNFQHKHDVTAEDIAKQISGYFEDDILDCKNLYEENRFSFLRKLWKCQYWLIERYSIREFESLGYGDMFLFIEKFMHLLPQDVQMCLTGHKQENFCLDACLLPLELDVLLSQAFSNLWENEITNLQSISALLARQFPSVSFKLLKSDSAENFVDVLRGKTCKMTSKRILFSTSLLKLNYLLDSSVRKEKQMGETNGFDDNSVCLEGILGSSTTRDAIDVLLKAPMLIDLNLWSHWNLLFAPSLGSIVEWLLKEVNTEELLCLVTKHGKVMRLNQSATLNSFLKVFIQRSPYETAVELLSLYALFGGERSVPLSLLKCHARQAFEVLINNSLEMEVCDDNNNLLAHVMRSCDQYMGRVSTSSKLRSSSSDKLTINNNTVRVMSRFILDCLSYLPIEFCSFAADLLISGLQNFVKGVPSAILNECTQIEQRLMLHEVGLSLGLVEWVNDYHSFVSSETTLISSGSSGLDVATSKFSTSSMVVHDIPNKHPSSGEMLISTEAASHNVGTMQASSGADSAEVLHDGSTSSAEHFAVLDNCVDTDAVKVIESIREEEFGLTESLSATEDKMLQKQHARLGRALHCLSQELYSQDSHFLLELVQNADDNIYRGGLEPTLTFILQERGIIVLNNEKGFSANNIRALCDVGNSTKKGHNAGYIGKKGIGFKSVFRVTDAPEIHSNGFHIKFDITKGQIGFVLPTIIPPCDVNLYSRLASEKADVTDNSWNTCIVLPFRSNLLEGFAMNSVVSMFSDLHPSLLLFLHRLQCIKFRNLLDDSLIVMRKEVIGDGIVQVALDNKKMTWFVVSQKLQADVIRSDVQKTEISVAFTLQETDGGYTPILQQQPVFAFLPLRTYGLKFILQGDFVLPSSREEVDGNSPWNQWLLLKFPDLFVSAERSFCDLPCYRGNPGKAVAAYMSFIPLMGEVHGFFSSLPRMIISKLRMSNCLILEGGENEWVPPCKVLRNCSEEARSLLPQSLLQEHLGLGFLNKDIVLSDALARALGVEDYGPKILLRIISSLCQTKNGMKSMGFSWLSSCLSAIYVMSSQSPINNSSGFECESDFIFSLQKTPFIPLSDGEFASVKEGTIWLHSEFISQSTNDEYDLKAFSKLYAKLRIVSSELLVSAASIESSCSHAAIVENVTKMLYKVGVQRLSAHEIVKAHILPAISVEGNADGQDNLMIEYLSFVMFHLQSSCTACSLERNDIITKLREKALILTNYGFRRSNNVAIHFSREYKNPIDVKRLVCGLDVKWHEIDIAYLKHPITNALSDGMSKWRIFFQDIGVTDFVQIVQVEKRVANLSLDSIKDIRWCRDKILVDSIAKDWESDELLNLLSWISSKADRQKSIYLLEILDSLWDDYFSDKLNGHHIDCAGECKQFKSSFIINAQDIPWIVSSTDNKLHNSKDLFYDCVAVNSLLGASAPYTIPKLRNEKLVADLGLKTRVTIDDALSILRLWKGSESPFMASVSQMSNFYGFLCNEMATSKKQIMEELHSGPFIFVPYMSSFSHNDVVPGVLLSPQEVYWHDNVNQVEPVHTESQAGTAASLRKTLYNIYPGFHDFFVNECGVSENPPLRSYLQILLHLSCTTLPHNAAKRVFEIFLRWADALISGSLSPEDVMYLKESLLKRDYTILPTRLDKWVSLHISFGLVCWCDDDNLGKEFKNLEGVDFLYLGELTDEENQMLHTKVSTLMHGLGIPALSKVVTREAIYYGAEDSSFFFSLVNWILPYAQRYLYNIHPDKYSQLKQSDFENVRRLKIVVVEKLFYRNVIKRCEITSKKRHECNCLLQDNILYCCKGSDPHPIFLEFSRLLFDGAQELHFANFLHMITTMAESGAKEEQTEFFILNSQKVKKLPVEESSWLLQSVSSTVDTDAALVEDSLQKAEEHNSGFKRRSNVISNWPPLGWKTAPGFESAFSSGLKNQSSASLQITEANVELVNIDATESNREINLEDEQTVATQGAISLDTDILEPRSIVSNNSVSFGMSMVLDSANSDVNTCKLNLNGTDELFAQQAKLTGRLGELVAFKYFVEKVGGEVSVKWVNEANETGLPYDIMIGKDESSKEYIEVKATKSSRKNWFLITMREWQFAIEKGESFSIAHVILSDENMAKVTTYKNPARLCQLGNLKLAIVVPKE